MTRERKGTFSKACSNVPGQSSIAPWKHLSGPASLQKRSRFKDNLPYLSVCSESSGCWSTSACQNGENLDACPQRFVVTSQTRWSCEWQSAKRTSALPAWSSDVGGLLQQHFITTTNISNRTNTSTMMIAVITTSGKDSVSHMVMASETVPPMAQLILVGWWQLYMMVWLMVHVLDLLSAELQL